jgi:hypothetical protein
MTSPVDLPISIVSEIIKNHLGILRFLNILFYFKQLRRRCSFEQKH